jgi:hypothetical protein
MKLLPHYDSLPNFLADTLDNIEGRDIILSKTFDCIDSSTTQK